MLGEILELSPEVRLAYVCYSPLKQKEKARQREQYAVSTLLQQLLQTEEAPQRAHHPDGSPYLPAYPAHALSISHTDGCVAVLLAPQGYRLGVDVEAFRPALLRTTSRYLQTEELATFFSEADAPLPLPTRYTLFWTAKEVAYKMSQPSNGSLLNYRVSHLDPDGCRLQLLGEEGFPELCLSYILLPPFVLTYGFSICGEKP